MKKKVYYLFSRNKKIGSRLISWMSSFITSNLENGIPSHVAVMVEDSYGFKLVYESTLDNGVRIIPYGKWLEINELLYTIECKKQRTDFELYTLLDSVWGKPYDWTGILYFAMRSIGFICFKIKYPYKNRWSSSKKFFCTEYAGRLSGYNYGMTTPAKMCSDFLKEQ